MLSAKSTLSSFIDVCPDSFNTSLLLSAELNNAINCSLVVSFSFSFLIVIEVLSVFIVILSDSFSASIFSTGVFFFSIFGLLILFFVIFIFVLFNSFIESFIFNNSVIAIFWFLIIFTIESIVVSCEVFNLISSICLFIRSIFVFIKIYLVFKFVFLLIKISLFFIFKFNWFISSVFASICFWYALILNDNNSFVFLLISWIILLIIENVESGDFINWYSELDFCNTAIASFCLIIISFSFSFIRFVNVSEAELSDSNLISSFNIWISL